MPNLHAIPEADLPPISPDRHFFYCPNPLEMTDEELEVQFPRQQRIEFLRDVAEAIKRHKQYSQPITTAPQRRDMTALPPKLDRTFTPK